MTPDKIKTALADHQLWLDDNSKGKRADLSGADLRGADLRGANLRGAYLSGADLGGADLGGADLGGANLSGADLSGAYLGEAYLGEDNPRRANLSGANLGWANLSGADLSGADHVIALGQPNGWWTYAYLWESAIWVRVGCRTFSITEGRTYWANKDDRREVLAALDYAETIAKLRGWEFGK